MSILDMIAGEDIEFQNILSGFLMYDSFGNQLWRSDYVRGRFAPPELGLTPLTRYLDSIPITPVTSVWLSCRFYMQDGVPNHSILGMADSTQEFGGIFIGKGSANQKLGLFTVKTDQTETRVTEEAGSTFLTNILLRIDMQITNFNSASTNIKVYLNQNTTPTINWTGNTTGLGITALDCFRWVHNDSVSPGRQAVTEIILADDDTRKYIGVPILACNAAGTTNTTDSGAYTDINEIRLDDTNMLQFGFAGQIFEGNLTSAPAGNYNVRAVKVIARASKGDSGPGTLKIGIDSGGTDDGVSRVLTTVLTSYVRLMATNPITSGFFTIAELNALQLYLESAA